MDQKVALNDLNETKLGKKSRMALHCYDVSLQNIKIKMKSGIFRNNLYRVASELEA